MLFESRKWQTFLWHPGEKWLGVEAYQWESSYLHQARKHGQDLDTSTWKQALEKGTAETSHETGKGR